MWLLCVTLGVGQGGRWPRNVWEGWEEAIGSVGQIFVECPVLG